MHDALSDLPHDDAWRNSGAPFKDDTFNHSGQKRHHFNGELAYYGGKHGGYKVAVEHATDYQKMMRENVKSWGPLLNHEGSKAPRTVLEGNTTSMKARRRASTASRDKPSNTVVGALRSQRKSQSR